MRHWLDSKDRPGTKRKRKRRRRRESFHLDIFIIRVDHAGEPHHLFFLKIGS
jgi:hypothetical protein